MKTPRLSKHFQNRTPSVIRSSQIEYSKRSDKKSVHVINLAIGNISLPMHPSMISRLKNLGHESFENGIVKYTSTDGNKETKDAFLNILAAEGIDTKGIYVNITDGGSAAMELMMLGVCNPGSNDTIMLLDPAYTNYYDFAKRFDVKIVSTTRSFNEDGSFAQIDIAKIEKILKVKKPKGLVVIPFDNPTGQFISQNDLEKIGSLCVKYGVWLISDEAYRSIYYTNDEKSSSIWNLTESCLSGISGIRIGIESSSKIWNACGLRIGALLTDNPGFHEKAVSEYTANLCANALGQNIFGSLANESHNSILSWFDKQKKYYQKIIFKMKNEFEKLIPGIIISNPEAAIYFIIDLKNIVDKDFDSVDFTMYCATKGKVKIDNEYYTLFLAPMKGFYINPQYGTTQLRVAMVEDYRIMIKAPFILSKLLNKYLNR